MHFRLKLDITDEDFDTDPGDSGDPFSIVLQDTMTTI